MFLFSFVLLNHMNVHPHLILFFLFYHEILYLSLAIDFVSNLFFVSSHCVFIYSYVFADMAFQSRLFCLWQLYIHVIFFFLSFTSI